MNMARTCCLLAVLTSTSSHAELLPRGVYDGVALVYDSDLNLTWVADANLAGTLASDDGLRNWEAAQAWVKGLKIAGLTDWRLPRTAQPDPSCEKLRQPRLHQRHGLPFHLSRRRRIPFYRWRCRGPCVPTNPRYMDSLHDPTTV